VASKDLARVTGSIAAGVHWSKWIGAHFTKNCKLRLWKLTSSFRTLIRIQSVNYNFSIIDIGLLSIFSGYYNSPAFSTGNKDLTSPHLTETAHVKTREFWL